MGETVGHRLEAAEHQRRENALTADALSRARQIPGAVAEGAEKGSVVIEGGAVLPAEDADRIRGLRAQYSDILGAQGTQGAVGGAPGAARDII